MNCTQNIGHKIKGAVFYKKINK